MRQSQYLESYLAGTKNPKTRYTPSTYLAYTLRGTAKHTYGDVYLRALMNGLNRLIKSGEVQAVASVNGSTAFIRKETN